jgi:hypothetical protein
MEANKVMDKSGEKGVTRDGGGYSMADRKAVSRTMAAAVAVALKIHLDVSGAPKSSEDAAVV